MRDTHDLSLLSDVKSMQGFQKNFTRSSVTSGVIHGDKCTSKKYKISRSDKTKSNILRSDYKKMIPKRVVAETY